MAGTVKRVVFWGVLSAIALGALLWPGDAAADAHDENAAARALQRLVNFIKNARLSAFAMIRTGDDGQMYLAVTDGGLAPADVAALPKQVDGFAVKIERRV